MPDRILSQGKVAALRLLREAYEDATETNRSAKDFAVASNALLKAGATETDLRWLIAEKLAEQLIEVSRDGDRERTFHAAAGMRLVPGACFVLTHSGKVISDGVAIRAPSEKPKRTALEKRAEGRTSPAATAPTSGDTRVRICWNKLRHELRVNGKLAKRFLHRAPLQWLVLDRFQSGKWKGPIAIVPPGESKRDIRQRLRELVKELNHGLDVSLIKFRKDPSGPGYITFDVKDPA